MREEVRNTGWGRSPGEGHGNPLQCSCLGNPMDRGAWRAPVHEVAQSQTQLSTHTTPGNAAEAPGPGGCLQVGCYVNGGAILQQVIPVEGNADFILNLLSLQTD